MHLTDSLALKPVAKSWFDQNTNWQAPVVNPPNGAVIGDTGPLPEGFYDFCINVAGTANHFYFEIQLRNAANTATIGRLDFSFAAYNTQRICFESFYMELNRRLRIVSINAAVGSFIGSFVWFLRGLP